MNTKRSALRLQLDGLEIGQVLPLTEPTEREFFINARRNMLPKRFSIRKIPRIGWRVERVQ